MKRLMIDGRKEKIPPFPNHKNQIFRMYQFFMSKSFWTHLTHGNFITVKEVIRGLKHKCALPRVLLLDPTSSCNLRCKGCWAADYAKSDNLSYEKLDDIITQSEALGIMDIYFSGGEPLVRKDDIIRLCRKHRKTSFGAFTNATLIDDKFADEIADVGNLNMFISIEGTREETDFRRGSGVYDQAVAAMQRLKDRGVAFAFSACYHSGNYQTIADSAFLDDMRRRGAWFGWLFNYVPVGQDADLSLVCTPKQRAYVKDKVEKYSALHNYAVIDFWNTGHTAYGCVAAGSGFLHINARGDVEPCAFCHYSDVNINDATILDALRSPFMTAFRLSQPFSDNPLRACPMIDVPDAIIKTVKQGGAHSTHYSAPESAEAFAEKTRSNAEQWKPMADTLLGSLDKKKAAMNRHYIGYLKFRRRFTDGKRMK